MSMLVRVPDLSNYLFTGGLGHQPPSLDNEWIEVMRAASPDGLFEGNIVGGGCWFWAAAGSGMWINSRRSVPVKPMLGLSLCGPGTAF